MLTTAQPVRFLGGVREGVEILLSANSLPQNLPALPPFMTVMAIDRTLEGSVRSLSAIPSLWEAD